MSDHSVQLKVYLTPEEYFATKHLGRVHGLSDSALLRWLLNQEARRVAMQEVSAELAMEKMAEMGLSKD